jgi:hypothetical protein
VTRQRLPSTEQQVAALKKKGINIGRARTKWTIYRLYNFYITQHHPKTTPVTYAYATSKKTFSSIEQSKTPEKMMVRTGTGKKVSARNLIRKLDQTNRKEFERSLPRNVSFQYGRTYRTVDKVRDQGTFIIDPPIAATVLTLDHAHKRAEQVISQLLDVIHLAQRFRGRFYKDYVVGGKIVAEGRNFDTSDDMPKNPPIVVSMPWTGLYREDFMFHRMFMDQGFEDVFKVLHATSAQDKAKVIIYRVELKFSTNRRPSNTDRLRSE